MQIILVLVSDESARVVVWTLVGLNPWVSVMLSWASPEAIAQDSAYVACQHTGTSLVGVDGISHVVFAGVDVWMGYHFHISGFKFCSQLGIHKLYL